MKHRRVKTSITGLLLSLIMLTLLACAAQTVKTNNTSTSGNESSSDPPTVAFCDLVRDPARYDGKVVHTEAIVAVGFEVGIIYDPKCGDSEKRVWYDFDMSTYNENEKGWKALRQLLFPKSEEQHGRYTGRAKATMIGRFDASDKNGYGHLNQYHFKFTIKRVERAEAVPSSVPE